MTARKSILDEAESLINGDRNNSYGPPTQDFERTSIMWSAYLGKVLQAHDVAAMMCLLKLSRIAWSPSNRDHWVDMAGYAACGFECVVENIEPYEPTWKEQMDSRTESST
jgi:hypothetical protein